MIAIMELKGMDSPEATYNKLKEYDYVSKGKMAKIAGLATEAVFRQLCEWQKQIQSRKGGQEQRASAGKGASGKIAGGEGKGIWTTAGTCGTKARKEPPKEV